VMIFAMGVVPLVCLLFGTSAISEEVDDRTLPYLFTRPVRKEAVVLGKALGMWLVSAALVAAAFCIMAAILWTKRIPSDFQKHPRMIFELLGVLVLATLPYTAFFVFLGTVLRRPLIPAILFAFGIEKALAFMPASVQRLSFFHYVRAMVLPYDDVSQMLRGMERDILASVDQPTPLQGILWLLGFTVAFAALSAWVIGRREYVLGKGD
jgi:ABC-2 type transport system permease protein